MADSRGRLSCNSEMEQDLTNSKEKLVCHTVFYASLFVVLVF